jgi:hypothetical protein
LRGEVGDFEKKFPAWPFSTKKYTCTNKLREKISCPIIWWEKKCWKTAFLQGSI